MLRLLGLMCFCKRPSGFSGGFVFLCCVQHMLMLCDHVRFVWAFLSRFICYYRKTDVGSSACRIACQYCMHHRNLVSSFKSAV